MKPYEHRKVKREKVLIDLTKHYGTEPLSVDEQLKSGFKPEPKTPFKYPIEKARASEGQTIDSSQNILHVPDKSLGVSSS